MKIAVDWPDGGPLSETQWRRRMEDLKDRATDMIGRLDVPLQDQAALATQFFGVAWSAVSPEVVFASASASLAVGQNLLVSQTPAAQLVEISERLEAIWLAAQSDPAAGVACVGPLLLETGPVPDHAPRTRRSRAKAVEPAEHDVEEELEPAVEALEPAAPAPAADADELPFEWRDASAPAPAVAPAEPAPAADTSNWLSLKETAELLGIATTSVGRWRTGGRLGREGIDWAAEGRSFLFSPGRIEELLP